MPGGVIRNIFLSGIKSCICVPHHGGFSFWISENFPIYSLYDSRIWTPGLAGFGQNWICWPSTILLLASLCTVTGWYHGGCRCHFYQCGTRSQSSDILRHTQSHHQELLLLLLDMGFQHQTSWIPFMLSPHWMLIWRVPSFFWGQRLPALAYLLHLLLACLLLHIRPWIS